QETLYPVYYHMHLYGYDVLYHCVSGIECGFWKCPRRRYDAVLPAAWNMDNRGFLADLPVLYEFFPDPEAAEGVRTVQYTWNGKTQSGQDPDLGEYSDRSDFAWRRTCVRNPVFKAGGTGRNKDAGRRDRFCDSCCPA